MNASFEEKFLGLNFQSRNDSPSKTTRLIVSFPPSFLLFHACFFGSPGYVVGSFFFYFFVIRKKSTA